VLSGALYASGPSVVSIPTQGGAITTVSGATATLRIGNDGTAIYCGTDNCGRGILSRARPGEAPTVVGSIPGPLDSFAFDADHIYVSDYQDLSIIAIDKPL
jgi:hypothetical protein